jgi:hypothetical protein
LFAFSRETERLRRNYSWVPAKVIRQLWEIRAEFAGRAEKFLMQIQAAVKVSNSQKFASLVRYPIVIATGTKKVQIRTAADLIRKYPSIVTSTMKQAILAQDPKCLFANGQGVMIDHGQIWFAEQDRGMMKIITITVE